jgi:structure-specific recognition protein 1
MQMRGTPYLFNIPYKNMDSFFLLPKNDGKRNLILLCLKQAIRMGNQKYQHLVMETHSLDKVTVTMNLSQEEIDEKYPQLAVEMEDELHNILGKVFKNIAGIKGFIPKQFIAANGGHSIRCSIKANDGLLYPLAKAFVFVHKPTLVIKFEDIESVDFDRYNPAANSGILNTCTIYSMKILID